MSLFNAFGQGGFAALSQTLENLGNIVAPIAPAENDDAVVQRREEESDEEEDDRTTFDSKIQNFFSSMRDSMTSVDTNNDKELEPGSPGSLVSVELSDDSPRSTESKGSRARALFDNRANSGNSFGVVSGIELDKKVQLKYREQLESEIENLEHKYADLQRTSTKRLQLLEQECQQWKQLAEGTGMNNLSDATDREEEISTLYEKLGSLTNELESKEEELAAAQETILAMNSESLSSNLSLVSTQTELQTQYESTRKELERLDEQNCQLADQLEEARETIQRLEEDNSRSSSDSKQNEEQLIALTNQLRASNKTINGLEQTVSELRSELAAAQSASQGATDSSQETRPALESVHVQEPDRSLLDRIQELQQQVEDLQKGRDSVSRAYAESQARVEELQAEKHVLSEQIECLLDENDSFKASVDSTSTELQSTAARLQESVKLNEASQAALEHVQHLLDAERASHSAGLAQVQEQYQQDVAAAEQRRVHAETAKEEDCARLAELSALLHDQQERLGELITENEALRESANAKSAELKEAKAQLDSNVLHAAAQDEELQTSRELIVSAEAEMRKQNALLESHKEEISILKETLFTVSSNASVSGESSPTPSVPAEPSSMSSSGAEDALAAAQADFQKAVKKVKAVTKQLKDKEAEAQKHREEAVAARKELAQAQSRESALQDELNALRATPGAEPLVQLNAPTATADQAAHQQVITDLQAELARCRSTLCTTEEREAELDDALVASEDALKAAEDTARQCKAEASELLFALETEQRKLKEALQVHEELQSQLVQQQAALNAAEGRAAELDAALTSSEEALKSTEETVWQCKAEASELLFALECEQNKLKEALLAKDELQAQLTQMQADQRRMPLRQRSESTDSILSLSEADKSTRPDAGLPPVGPEDALSVAQANYSKAIRKIKAVNKQLKDKEADLLKSAQCAAELSATVETLQAELAHRTTDTATLKDELAAREALIVQAASTSADATAHHEKVQQLEDLLRAASADHATALNKVQALEARVEELSCAEAETCAAMQSAEATAHHISTELSQCQAALRAAEGRAVELDAALASSEEAVKSTEETAWQCKAEASELLFALECEQSKLKEAVLAKDDLQDKLAHAQAELAHLSTEKQATAQVADVEAVQKQLSAVYFSVIAALRCLDPQAHCPEHEPNFQHLLDNCSTDLLSPLKLLAMVSHSLPGLSEHIMAQLTVQSGSLSALGNEEQGTRAALAKCTDVLTLITSQLPFATTTRAVSKDGDNADMANRVADFLSGLIDPLLNLVASAQANSSEVARLAELIEQNSAQASAERDQWSSERLALRLQAEQAAAQIYSLQGELAETLSGLESCEAKHAQEKQHLLAEMNATQSNASQFTEQLQSLRLQVQKWETENKQLHQVIAQLRQVRKMNKGESDNAISERDELRNQCTALQSQVTALEQQLRYLSATEETNAQLQAELGQAHAALGATERNLEATRRAVAQLEKDCYDKDSELEVTRSDILLVRQELDRRLVEVGNLNEAIHQVETERAYTVARLQKDLAEKVEQVRRAAESGQDQALAELRRLLEEEKGKRVKLEEASQDHELFHRKAELDFIKEKKKMQRTLENALAQLNNSQQQVIDRMLVANLIVSYFKRRRSVEVLKIIAKVLAFDDEQLIAVGLKVPPIDIFATILSTVIGKPAPPPDVEGDNLAEQWINFLINESDQDASNSAGLVARSRSNSSSHSGGGASAPPSPIGTAKMSSDFK